MSTRRVGTVPTSETNLNALQWGRVVVDAEGALEGKTDREVRAVQREPFDRRGVRAEKFATGTRFAKERLWHVDLEFESPFRGPLVIGDGRFLGLGLMQPVQAANQVIAFSIVSGAEEPVQARVIAEALRRAVIARVQAAVGPRGTVPVLVCGHQASGAPAKGNAHLHFVHDPARARVLVVAPRGGVSARAFDTVRRSLVGFEALRAGRAGLLSLQPVGVDVSADPLFAPARTWRTVTPYAVDRHRDLGDADEAVAADVRAACIAAGLPAPSAVRVAMSQPRRGEGLTGSVEISFAVAVAGPLLLGRTRFKGGGVFEAADASATRTV